MDVIVLDDGEEEAQDSAGTSFMEEVNRDLGNDPQNFRALLPSLRSSVHPNATPTPFIRAMITRDRDIDPVEDYRGNASTPQGQPDPAPAAHVPQEESLEVTIEYEELHELLGDSNDTSTTLDEGDEVQDSGNNTIDLTEDEVVAPVAPSAGSSTASASYTLSYTCPICMDSYQSLTNRGIRFVSPGSCGHVFCWSCLKSALEARRSCPICRQAFMGSQHLRRVRFN